MCIGCHKVKSFIIFEHAHILLMEFAKKNLKMDVFQGKVHVGLGQKKYI